MAPVLKTDPWLLSSSGHIETDQYRCLIIQPMPNVFDADTTEQKIPSFLLRFSRRIRALSCAMAVLPTHCADLLISSRFLIRKAWNLPSINP